jgi:tetratricopeptide (TPR) repeat protein
VESLTLAYSYYADVFHGYAEDANEWVRQGLEAGERAVELDETDYFSHFVLGRVLALSGQGDRAISELERALALNPSYARGYLGLGTAQSWYGRAADAIPNLNMAMRLSPNDPVLWGMLMNRASCFNNLEDYEDAEHDARRAINMRPRHFGGQTLLAVALVGQDRMDEAQEAVAELRRVSPDFTLSKYRHIRPYVHSEYRQRSIDALRKAGLPDE